MEANTIAPASQWQGMGQDPGEWQSCLYEELAPEGVLAIT